MAKSQRLELTWMGKEIRPRLEPRILIEDESLSWCAPTKKKGDIFDNMLIFGDNLLALKSLEQHYTGKVKCVYIDPPYNTGYAFKNYDDGLEHSIWLGLMRDRMELLYRLLTNDGFIFVQIDDCEQAYLKVMMDEVFGRVNFVCNFIWLGRAGKGGTASQISNQHEYIICYRKTEQANLKKETRISSSGNYQDQYGSYKREQLRQWGQGDKREDRPSMWYPVIAPDKTEVFPFKEDGTEGRWRVGENTFKELIRDNLVDFVSTEKGWRVYRKIRDGRITESVYGTLLDQCGTSATGTAELKALFGSKTFDTPKPERLIERILTLASQPGDLVLDSFLGSGTTAAVAHKMRRRWIGIELGEHCHTHCIPRLKKVIDGEDKGGITEAVQWEGGGGFRYYRLAPSLLKKDKYDNWIINPEYNAEMLSEAVCKLNGFTYAPNEDVYWQQGKSIHGCYIYVTTQSLSVARLKDLSEEVGPNNTLLVVCKAFRGKADDYPNLAVKKIPKSVLEKCEWDHDDYSLKVENLPATPKKKSKTPLFDVLNEEGGDE